MGHPALELSGQTAVVIGGTSGIGRALALGLAVAGANVVPCGRHTEAAESTAEEILKMGRRSIGVRADVTQRGSLEALLEAVCAEFGSVEILVNSAGRIARTPALDISEGQWNEILDTNLTGMLRACQVFGRHMIDLKYGRILNIASLSSFVALYEIAAYSASKAGVVSLTRSLAIEWARYGVCVNALAPGVFRTALNAPLLNGTERGREFLIRTPMGRFGQLEDLAAGAVFLASEGARFVTGQVLAVDGGFLASGVNQ